MPHRLHSEGRSRMYANNASERGHIAVHVHLSLLETKAKYTSPMRPHRAYIDYDSKN